MYGSPDFERIKDLVISTIPMVESIFLFGSQASRGTAHEQSDIDIAVLLERELQWRERNRFLNRLYSETAPKGYNVDFVLKSADKFRTQSELPTLSRVILRGGRLLWTKS